jgi:hypothetical protein
VEVAQLGSDNVETPARAVPESSMFLTIFLLSMVVF